MIRRNNDNILEVLVQLPWWASVLVATAVYLVMAIVIPGFEFQNQAFKGLAQSSPRLATIFALVLLVPAPISFFIRYKKRKRLDSQRDINSIKDLPWRAFEELVAEVYRRQGYYVEENAFAGADGGVDIRLVRDGQTHLVQCKQWRSQKVGVAVVREMFGIMMAENATSVSIITSGMFTQEAQAFAADKPIDLIDGRTLVDLIASVQVLRQLGIQKTLLETRYEVSPDSNNCPKCGSGLVLRVAKKGSNAGGRFLGCSAFPTCRFTKPELK